MSTNVWHPKPSPMTIKLSLQLSIPLCIKTLSTLGPHPHKCMTELQLTISQSLNLPVLALSLFRGGLLSAWVFDLLIFSISPSCRNSCLVAMSLSCPHGISLTVVTFTDIVEKQKGPYMNPMLYFYSSFRCFQILFASIKPCTLNATLR